MPPISVIVTKGTFLSSSYGDIIIEFQQNLTDDPNDVTLVKTIITMAHKLKFAVLAEGVESGAHWQMLHGFGYDMAQGYYGGKPVPANEAVLRLPGRGLEPPRPRGH